MKSMRILFIPPPFRRLHVYDMPFPAAIITLPISDVTVSIYGHVKILQTCRLYIRQIVLRQVCYFRA